jgi:hypothetical protein
MARREGGGRGGREIPGLHDALLARARRTDDSWHIETDCLCCAHVAALVSGKPTTEGWEMIWRALYDRHYPERWDEFLHNKGWYTVTGDRLVRVDD